MNDRQATRGQRVTPLELFFDLVVVFAITQVTGFLARNSDWGGLLRSLMLLGALWWLWSGYAWLTNRLDPEEGAVRLAVFAAIAAMLIVALAVPNAFGADALTFAIAYSIVRGLQLVLLAVAGRGDPDFLHTLAHMAPGTVLFSALLIAAAFVHDPARLSLWCAALAVIYVGPFVYGTAGFRVEPDHFAERFGQIIIIALGESIVEIGVGTRGLPLTAGVITAALLGITIAASIWWSYFDWSMYVVGAKLAEATGAARATLGRDVYAYLHLPMVGGIVLFAFGLESVISDVGDALDSVAAVAMCGGIALYMLAHVALRLRIGGGLGRGRPTAAVASLAVVPIAMYVPGLAALSLLAGVCVGLIAYEFYWHRSSRAFVRSRRSDFNAVDFEEFRRQGLEDRRRRRSSAEVR